LVQMNFGQLEHKMGHLACFAGGMFAIGGQSLADSHKRDDLISLNEWVFNTEAHPLPILTKNPAFPKK